MINEAARAALPADHHNLIPRTDTPEVTPGGCGSADDEVVRGLGRDVAGLMQLAHASAGGSRVGAAAIDDEGEQTGGREDGVHERGRTFMTQGAKPG